MRYRPWGSLNWVIGLSDEREWKFIGTIGTEERSLACWSYAHDLNLITGELFCEIHDLPSDKYGERVERALSASRQQFALGKGSLDSVHQFPLMTELFNIQRFSMDAEAMGKSIIFDITSYPKRFFFVILRDLMECENVENLIVTYTSPQSHPPEDEPLYEDPDTWKELPGFGATSNEKRQWIVSVGFLAESLNRYIGDHPDTSMKLLIPFPGPLESTRRIWNSVASLDNSNSKDRFEMFRVDTIDLSAAFDRITSLSRGSSAIAFAPLGPKPISAAMCLYAIQKDASVHYPQPTVYHPEYSKGLLGGGPETAINAYWIKHKGKSLYNVD
jgi:hypothetical protein